MTTTDTAQIAYAEYLQSPGWRLTRDKALKRAHHRCANCESKRGLQVHHLTYERLGQEADGDLVVLCAGCHENQHPEQFAQDYLGRYLALAEEIIHGERLFTTASDFLEALKARCARLKLPYDTDRFSRAFRLTMEKYPRLVVPPVVQGVVDAVSDAPMSAHEARQLLRKMQIWGIVKPMPQVEPLTGRDYDRMKAAKMVAQEIQDSIERCEALERAVDEDKAGH